MLIYIKRGCSIFKNMHVDHVQLYMYPFNVSRVYNPLSVYLSILALTIFSSPTNEAWVLKLSLIVSVVMVDFI